MDRYKTASQRTNYRELISKSVRSEKKREEIYKKAEIILSKLGNRIFSNIEGKVKDPLGFIAYGIANKIPVYNIKKSSLEKDPEKAYTYRRFKSLINKTKNSKNIDSNNINIMTPYNAWVQYKFGKISRDEFIKEVEMWKKTSPSYLYGGY